jgi:TP901 family phage tail tape measure protein
VAVVIPIVTSYRGSGAKAAMRDLGRLQKQAELAGAGTAAGLLGASRSITSFGAGAAAVGMTLTKGITLPVAALGGLAIRESMKFSSAFAGVRKTIDATEPEFAKLRQGIRDMAKEIPASREAIAGVAEAAGQLGIENENVLSFTRTMIDMGESTNLAADEAATALARFGNITGMEQTNFDRLGSSIVALGNNMATTEAEVVNFGMRIAGAGAQVGMSEADIMGLSAAFSSVGISAEAGGTALSKTMINIEASVQKGGEQLRLWAETAGMSAAEFKQAWEKDSAGALTAVVKGLGEMEKQGGSTLGQLEKLGITEVRQRDALLRAAGAGDLLSDALKISGDAWKENGALAEEAGRRYETPESRLAIMKNRASDMGITIGDELTPSFLRLMEDATRLAERFGNLTDGQQDFIIKAALVGAAIGPVLVIVGRLTQGVGAAVGVAGKLSLAFSSGGAAAPGWARGIAGATKGLVSFVKQGALAIASLARQAASWVAETAAKAAATAATLAHAVAAKASAAAQWLLNAALSANPIGLVVIAIAGLVAALVVAYKKSETFRNIVNAAWGAIKTAAVAVFGFVANYIKTWVGIIRAVLGKVKAVADSVVRFFDRMRDGIVSAFNRVTGFLRTVAGKIKSAIGNPGRILYEVGKDIVAGLRNGISAAWHWVTDKLKGLIGGLSKAAKKVLGIGSPSRVFAAIGKDVAAGLAIGIDGGKDAVRRAAHGLAGATLPGFGAAGGYAVAAGAGGRSVVLHVAPGAVQINFGSSPSGSVSQGTVDAAVDRAFRRLAAELSRR